MAYKDILALYTSNNTYESVFVDISTGKKIFHDEIGFGQDFGQTFRQLDDDSFLQIDYDGMFYRRRDKNFKIVKDHFIRSNYVSGNFTKFAVNKANGDVFWYDPTDDVIKKSSDTREYGQSTTGTQISNGLLSSFPNIGGFDTMLVGALDGVQTVFVCGDGSGTDLIYHTPASASDNSAVWTAVAKPAGCDANRFVIVGTRLVAFNSNVIANDPAVFVADLSGATVTFDSGTIADATDTWSFSSTDDSGGITSFNNKVQLKSANNTTGVYKITTFDPVAKTFAHVDLGTGETEYVHSGTTRYTFPNATQSRVTTDGSIAIYAKKWDSVATPTTYISGFILMNSTLTSMVRELWFSAESDPNLADDSISGYEILRLNEYKIEGNVTKDAAPVENAKVGILNSDGSIDLKTTTDASGNYTLFCFSSEARQVVAIDSAGNSQVHLVTPVEVV